MKGKNKEREAKKKVSSPKKKKYSTTTDKGRFSQSFFKPGFMCCSN
jgi:hypothetical protein